MLACFQRLPAVRDGLQVPAVLSQRLLQHVNACVQAVEGRLPCGQIDALNVDDVVDAELVLGGLVGRSQHDAKRIVGRQEPGEKGTPRVADVFGDRPFVVAIEQGGSGELADVDSHFVGGVG